MALISTLGKVLAPFLQQALDAAKADEATIVSTLAKENQTLANLLDTYLTNELSAIPALRILSPYIGAILPALTAKLVADAGSEESAVVNLLLLQAQNEINKLA